MAHIKIISYSKSQISEGEITQRLQQHNIAYCVASTEIIFVDYAGTSKNLYELIGIQNKYMFIGDLVEHNSPYWGYLHMSNWQWLKEKYSQL